MVCEGGEVFELGLNSLCCPLPFFKLGDGILSDIPSAINPECKSVSYDGLYLIDVWQVSVLRVLTYLLLVETERILSEMAFGVCTAIA